MKSASVSEAKSRFGALVDDLRREGEAALVRRGIANPPRVALDIERFLASPAPRLPDGVSASRVVAAEREEGP